MCGDVGAVTVREKRAGVHTHALPSPHPLTQTHSPHLTHPHIPLITTNTYPFPPPHTNNLLKRGECEVECECEECVSVCMKPKSCLREGVRTEAGGGAGGRVSGWLAGGVSVKCTGGDPGGSWQLLFLVSVCVCVCVCVVM